MQISPMPTLDVASLIELDGYAVVPGVLSKDAVEGLIDAVSEVAEGDAIRKRKDSVFAIRNLLDCVPLVARLAVSDALRALVEPILGEKLRPVRAILFDKTAGANWNVFWHQDLSIAVQERKDIPGFGPWTVKSGVQHVQPPAAILEQMLTIRLHLDDCGETNGPLQVISGSHRHGRMSPETVREWRETKASVTCTANSGDALVMRPLLLHSSSSASSAAHRRVVHIEYAGSDLPDGLRWQSARSRCLTSD